METLKIRGGKSLQGTIRAAGAKNAMTKLLVASLLSDKRCRFYNVPDIGDVEITVGLCKEIGMEVQLGSRSWCDGGHHARTEDLLHSLSASQDPIAFPF